jgi:hypothetical protein
LLLDDHGIVKSGRLEPSEVPATKRTLEAIAETENYLGIVSSLFIETVAKQSESLRNQMLH